MPIVFKDRVKTSPGSTGNDGPGYSGGHYDVDKLLLNQATSSSVVTTVTSFLAQPTIAAKIVLTPGGTTGDNPLGVIAVAGTDFEGTAQTEDVAITENIAAAVETVATFATVTSVTFPIMDGAGSTWSVGQSADMLYQLRSPDGNGMFVTEVLVHFPVAPTTLETLTISVNAAAGANFDAALHTAAYAADGSVANTHWTPTVPIYFEKDDILTMTFPNTDQGLFGIQVVSSLLA